MHSQAKDGSQYKISILKGYLCVKFVKLEVLAFIRHWLLVAHELLKVICLLQASEKARLLSALLHVKAFMKVWKASLTRYLFSCWHISRVNREHWLLTLSQVTETNTTFSHLYETYLLFINLSNLLTIWIPELLPGKDSQETMAYSAGVDKLSYNLTIKVERNFTNKWHFLFL